MKDLNSEIDDLKKRIEKLETQITYLLRKEGADIAVPELRQLPADVVLLAKQGKFKDAIRLFMDTTGASLKDAKEAVESIK